MQPGQSLNSQPFGPISGSTMESEITFSSPLSVRKISVRFAQGQASET